MHEVGRDGGLLECAEGVEGGRTCLLPRERKSKDGSDKEHNLCAGHEAALPRVRHPHHNKETAREQRLLGVFPPSDPLRSAKARDSKLPQGLCLDAPTRFSKNISTEIDRFLEGRV